MNRKSALFSLFVILFVFCLPNVFSASCVGINFNFTCGSNVNQSCTFDGFLNCTGIPNFGLNISNDNIIIDGAGQTIISSASSDGIYNNGKNNITIKNLFINSSRYGIFFDTTSKGIVIINNTIKNSIIGILIDQSFSPGKEVNNTNISFNKIINCSLRGLAIAYINNLTLENNFIYNTSGIGLSISVLKNATLKNNFILNSTQDGFKLYYNSFFPSSNINISNLITCYNNNSGGSYFDYVNDTLATETNTTCDTSNPLGICDNTCYSYFNIAPNITLVYPLQNQTFNSSTTSVTLNWTSYDNEPITDKVYVNNGSGYYELDSQSHNPGNYSTSLNVISDTIYFWYVNTSDGLDTTKSEIRNFTIELNPPTIYNISTVPNPVEIGENITLNATVILGDNPISVVWATIWQGATIIWTGILNFVSGTLYSIIVPTNVTFTGANNYTIYANDTLGNNATSVSGNFTASANPPNITLNSPNNSQIFKSVTSVTLNWTSGDDGASVNDSVYVYNSTNWNVVYSASHTPGTYIYDLSVLNGTIYQWYVTTNDGTSTVQSETRNFTNSYSCVGTTFNFICGDNINQSCSFNGDLYSEGNCFNITTNSTIIDCNSKLLDGNLTGVGLNVYLDLQNVTIKNCLIKEFNTNIIFSGSNGTIENSTLRNSFNNTLIIIGEQNIINKTIYQQNNYGILVNGSNNLFYSNFINYTYYDGIKFTSTVMGNSLTDSTICLNNRAGGSYYDYYDLDSTTETNTTCDTSNPLGICDYACTGGSLEPSVILNSPINDTSFPDTTTSVTLNWTSSYYTGNVTDIVYVNNGSGYYILSNETHTPGTYNLSLPISNSFNYSWYVNTSVGSKINQSEIWIFSIQDSINPTINLVTDYPDPQASYWNVTINASITNNTFPIDKATVRVENPLGNIIYTGNLSLIGGRWIDKITTNDGFLGTNYYFVSANNTIGGNSNTLNSTFTINNPSPSIILNSPSNGYSYPTGTTQVTLNFTSIDNNPSVTDTIFLLNETGDTITFNTATHTPGTYTFVVNVTNGRTYSWYVISDDAYSNQTTSATRTFSVGSATTGCVGATTTFICGQTINESCTMNGDLTTTDICFRTGASNIIIDGNGQTISGSKSLSYFGIRDLSGYDNLTIKNFNFKNLGYGIYLQGGVQNSTIYNNTINNTIVGIGLVTTLRNVIDSNQINNSDKGISLEANSNQYNNITNNVLFNNQIGLSFYQSYYTYTNNNSIFNSKDIGLSMNLSYYNNFYNNLVYNSTNYGIYLASNAIGNNLQNTITCNTSYISTAGWCYQETANISTVCGGLNTGKYELAVEYFYINYTKPTGTLNTSKWQVKYLDVDTTNLTIPNRCWNQPNLMFRIYSRGDFIYNVTPQCYNGTAWQNIGSSSLSPNGAVMISNCTNQLYDGNWNTMCSYIAQLTDNWMYFTTALGTSKIYEEAMWWDMTSIVSNYDYYDLDSNTETNTTCDTSNPTGKCDIYCNGTIINPVNPNNTTIILNSPANGASYPDTTTSVTLNFTSNSSLTTLIDSIYVNPGTGYVLVYQQSHSKGTYTYAYPISASGTYLWYATTNDSTTLITSSVRNFTISGTSYPLVTLISPADGSSFNYQTRQVQLKWNCYDPYFSTLTNRLYVNGNLVYSASLAPGNRTYVFTASEGQAYSWYVQCQSPIRTTTSSIWDFEIQNRAGFECTTDFLGFCKIIKEISIGTNNMFNYWWAGLFVILIAIVVMGLLIMVGIVIADKFRRG